MGLKGGFGFYFDLPKFIGVLELGECVLFFSDLHIYCDTRSFVFIRATRVVTVCGRG